MRTTTLAVLVAGLCSLSAPADAQQSRSGGASAGAAQIATVDGARKLLADGAVNQSIVVLRQVVRSSPENVEALLVLGHALTLVNEWSEAVRTLQHAVKLSPDSADGHYALGTALARFGDSRAALPHLERAVQLAPSRAEAHIGLALVAAQQKNLAAARDHLSRAIALQGNSPDAAYAHYLLAQVLREQGEAAKALEQLDAAIARRSDYADAYLSRGLIKEKLLDQSGALEAFETAARLAPDNHFARAALGEAYLRERRAAEAIPHLEYALRARPMDRATRYHLCRAFRLAGRQTDAETCAQKVTERLQKTAAGDVAAGIANDEAIALEAQGRLAEALEGYRKAVELDPFNTLFRRNLALALCRLGRWEEGIKELEQVIETNPNDQEATRALFIAKEQVRKR